MFADAHLHSIEFDSNYHDGSEASCLFCCAASRRDWEELQKNDDPRLTRFYGVHPWYADEYGSEAGEELRSILRKDPHAGVGEIGLDRFRNEIGLQRRILLEQLEIAADEHRAVQIHNAGCDEELLGILRGTKNTGPVILHSFGSESYVRPLTDMGCYFSINPRILRRSATRIFRLVSAIPEDRLLLESDYPSVPKEFTGMGDFAKRLSESCGIREDRLIELSLDNARRIAEWKA